MMSENDLCDIFRVRNPDMKHYTWRRKTPFKQRRLDYFLISDQLQDQIDQVDIIPSIQSDHLTLKLKICGAKCSCKGPFYWKLNNSLLQDKVFIELMKSEIPKFYQESEELRNPMTRWEYLKYKVRDFSKQYSVDKAREQKAKRNKLELSVKELEALISSNAEETLIQEYHKCKHQFEEIYNYVTQGIIIHSKVDWYEYGEKSSKYFLNFEKRNKANIRKILNSNLVELSEPETVLSSIKSFYSTLYKKRNDKTETDCYNYLKTLNLPKLTDNESRLCEEELTKRECWEALQTMGNNKSPGNDGLSKDYYVCFFNKIHSYLLQSLNTSFREGQLSSTQRQAVIVLIEKKDKDKRFLKNWRPISLINVDAKIASKAIALRIKKVIGKLIHWDQTAYVGNRNIGESVRLISDILEYTDENDIEAILFSADFEKAFHSVEDSFIISILRAFEFLPDFIQWVKTFFKNVEGCVMNNGSSTGYFPLERGTRQGDPISAYLFILALEILLIQIRKNADIKGIIIDETEIKLSAYADDGSFFVTDIHSLQAFFFICNQFREFSSLKLNLEKSEACWNGKAKGREDKPIDCHWINLYNDIIRILGVCNSYDTDLESSYNFFSVISKIKACLKCWEGRCLTIAGRIQIFKTFAISKTLYIDQPNF